MAAHPPAPHGLLLGQPRHPLACGRHQLPSARKMGEQQKTGVWHPYNPVMSSTRTTCTGWPPACLATATTGPGGGSSPQTVRSTGRLTAPWRNSPSRSRNSWRSCRRRRSRTGSPGMCYRLLQRNLSKHHIAIAVVSATTAHFALFVTRVLSGFNSAF